jgi:CSLREA domain-containing protein
MRINTVSKRILSAFAVLACGVALSACSGSPILTVNTTNDADDGTCDAAHCSLREALHKANSFPMSTLVTIRFNIGGGGLQTIRPGSSFGLIGAKVFIDGTSQPGYGGTPLIELDGSEAGDTHGLNLIGFGSKVKGLIINRFVDSGIGLMGQDIIVQGNYIGTDSSGSIALGNGAWGIGVGCNTGQNAPTGMVIGGSSPADRNVISGNGAGGIFLSSSACMGNSQITVRGNIIGLNAAGTSALGNQGPGISLDRSAGSFIGGAGPGEGNIVSGNSAVGIELNGSGEHNVIRGNKFGTDAAGTAAVPNGASGIVVAGSDNDILGNLVSGNLGDGIRLIGGLNDVQGNRIGLDAGGTNALGNAGKGILISGSINRIGGAAAGEGNIISANGADGILVDGSSIEIKGNYIGTDSSGTLARGNAADGIRIVGNGGVLIGGNTPTAGNLISANGLTGINIADGSTEVDVAGNRIGTNAAGTAALGNIKSGIRIGGVEVRIGAEADGGGNLISGNGGAGIAIGDTATGVYIKNNLIGTNAAGTAALGNDIGIEVGHWIGAAVIQIGGSGLAPYQGNVISGNLGDGILAYFGAKIWGNRIGTDAGGTLAIGNGGNGIRVKGSDNVIGGEGDLNTIAFNGGHGVAVISESGNAVRNRIAFNKIHDNGGLGIAVDEDGVIPNDEAAHDADTGDNGRQNYPTLMTAQHDTTAGTLRIIGKFVSKPNTEYEIEYYANAACDPSGFGEGGTAVNRETLTTNGDGYAVVNSLFMESVLNWGGFFTATATDPDGNTSEFSNCVSTTEVPAAAAVTDTPAGMTFKITIDPSAVFWGRCEPKAVRISVQVQNPPEEVGYVLLFARLADPKSGQTTAWSEGLSMIAAGKNTFYYDLAAYDMRDFNQYPDGVVEYQFVVYGKAQKEIGRSEVYGDIAFKQCGRS